jgi:DNA-binding GntR family transcriptional regulator
VRDNPEILDLPRVELTAASEARLDTGRPPASVKAQAYDRILLDIVMGVLRPGAPVDEQGLAHRYDGGLVNVRRALERLSFEGLLIRGPRGAARVALIDAMEVRQILDVRRLLEPHAAGLAAEFASPEDIDALGRVFDGAEAAIQAGDHRTLFLMDNAFHSRLARASGNPALASLIPSLQLKAARFWACSMAAGEGPKNQVAVDQAEVDAHRAVVKLIAKRDTAGARAATLKALGVVRADIDRRSALAAGGRGREMLSVA